MDALVLLGVLLGVAFATAIARMEEAENSLLLFTSNPFRRGPPLLFVQNILLIQNYLRGNLYAFIVYNYL
jgi:hypothetical protein